VSLMVRSALLDGWLQDLRYALRMCRRRPGFTAVAVLALALGIGANTAIFSIVNAVLLERLPYGEPERIAAIWEVDARRSGQSNTVSPANFIRWGERATTLEALAGFSETRMNLTEAGNPAELIVQMVTPSYFAVLGVSPMLGRIFTPEESATPLSSVVILTHDVWRRQFSSDPSVVGRTIRLNGRPRTVVGVMPPGYRLFLKAGAQVGKPVDLWIPLVLPPDAREPRGRYLSVIGRLKQGRSVDELRAEMSAISSSLVAELPNFNTGWGVKVVPLHDEVSGDVRAALLVLSGAVAFVLLIACANVANLLLARGASRHREIAVRVALGAGRFRVVRQLLTESLVLGICGGLAGLLIGRWSLAVLVALSPVDLTSQGEIGLSYPVLIFTAAVSILTAVVCGLAPALAVANADPQDALHAGARQTGGSARHRRLRHTFVVAEVALAVVLLVGAGLMLRSFDSLRRVDPGFDVSNVLTMRMQLPLASYREDARRVRFFRDLTERVAGIRGVRAAGVVSFLPLGASLGAGTGFTIEGQAPAAPGQGPSTDVTVSDNGYFRALNVRLVRGRLFTDREQLERSNVVIVNEALVRQYFPGQDPLGKRVTIAMTDDDVPTTIVGVVADTKFADLSTPAKPTSYWPHPQLAYNTMTLTVRTVGDPQLLATAVEREVHAIDKEQPVADVRPMTAWVARSLSQPRFNSTVLGSFAILALLLAALGVYGVMSYVVNQRTSEIGLRLALGADRRMVIGMIVGAGMRLAGAGLAIGLILALVLNRVISTLLFGTTGTDPLTFAVVIGVLAIAASLASYVPARRAARIAPIDALRTQ
jgi:putative ABC transport system permease protein